MACVYILRGKSGRHYIGSTDNLGRRLKEHCRGGNHTTRRLGGGIELVASKEFPSITEARKCELVLKRKKSAPRGVRVAVVILI
jgi:predicted GIY-YIG superfamily endonuclease